MDSTYKSSYWNPKEFQITGEGLYGEWRSICLTEIHRKYPEYTIMTLENANWAEWTGEDNKEEKTEDCRHGTVTLLYHTADSSLEYRTHRSTAENFANMYAAPVPRAYVKMQRTAQCIGDCHNSRQGGAWSSICKGVVLIRRRGFCFLPS